MALKFYYNGIKASGGKLETCFYSNGALFHHPTGTLTIYKRGYEDFSSEIRDAFVVENDTDITTDYVEQDRIRVLPDHPLYSQVKEALDKHTARYATRS